MALLNDNNEKSWTSLLHPTRDCRQQVLGQSATYCELASINIVLSLFQKYRGSRSGHRDQLG